MSTSTMVPRTAEDLCERFGAADEMTVKHKLPYIDEAATRFLAQCSFVIVATADAQGRCDASPKGDPAGFIHIADKHTVYLPDRPGNKMFQGISNILENPHIGLLCIIPGEEWTMRINGRARIVDDPTVLDQLIYVIEGCAMARVSGKEQEIKVGDLLMIPAGAPHALCTGNEQFFGFTVFAPPEMQ